MLPGTIFTNAVPWAFATPEVKFLLSRRTLCTKKKKRKEKKKQVAATSFWVERVIDGWVWVSWKQCMGLLDGCTELADWEADGIGVRQWPSSIESFIMHRKQKRRLQFGKPLQNLRWARCYKVEKKEKRKLFSPPFLKKQNKTEKFFENIERCPFLSLIINHEQSYCNNKHREGLYLADPSLIYLLTQNSDGTPFISASRLTAAGTTLISQHITEPNKIE